MSQAERRCLGCRQTDERAELVRLVRSPEGQVVVDLRARLPGRGAWVHPDRACVERVSDAGLSRALRAPAHAGELLGQLRSVVEVALRHGLSQAAAAGGLVGGHDQLVEALRDGRVVELAVAVDAAERTIRSLEAARGDQPLTVLPLNRDTLGALVGAGSRAAVGVLPDSACIHLRRQLQRLRRLG